MGCRLREMRGRGTCLGKSLDGNDIAATRAVTCSDFAALYKYHRTSPSRLRLLQPLQRRHCRLQHCLHCHLRTGPCHRLCPTRDHDLRLLLLRLTQTLFLQCIVVGIAIGGVVILVVPSILFICCKKKRIDHKHECYVPSSAGPKNNPYGGLPQQWQHNAPPPANHAVSMFPKPLIHQEIHHTSHLHMCRHLHHRLL